MKKITSLLSVIGWLMCVSVAQAQVPYTCITKGATLEYANYNDEGKLQGYTRQVILDVSDLSNGNYDVHAENTTIKKPGQKRAGDNAFITVSEVRDGCVHAYPNNAEGVINVIEGQDVLMLPARLAVGYQLPIGDIRLDAGGMASLATLTENEVIGREEVTTSAGTFKCYVIKQTISTSLLGFAMTTSTKSWYSRGIGLVKSETTMGGRIVSHMELVTYKPENTKK